ncbi:hypothetical protein CHH58_03245 [Terribacillus saccharophilus]|uniref:hypothetical protein n=1 Tax=Terribacillus saccharophilus TaxID=361277 RepID=UPI000BA64A3E|nr:hypothetical protein [Terribacillus saccharophilus]PAF38463.1 hypothetical protein CHH58_03245 [Terribacillus saccharophilus]
MNELVQDYERRIVSFEKKFEEMKNGMLKIENSVLAEGREQRAMLQLVKYSFDDRQHKRDNITKLKQIRWTTVSSILGTGRVVFLNIQWILGHF